MGLFDEPEGGIEKISNYIEIYIKSNIKKIKLVKRKFIIKKILKILLELI